MAPDISRSLFPSNSRKTFIACPLRRGMAVLREFDVWELSYLRSCCPGCNVVLYCTAIYREFIVLGSTNHTTGAMSNTPLKVITFQWRHNGRHGVSNHQPHDYLLNRLFRRKSKKTWKVSVTGLCAGNSPVTGEFPAQRASNAENASIWWRHHASHQIGPCSSLKPNELGGPSTWLRCFEYHLSGAVEP